MAEPDDPAEQARASMRAKLQARILEASPNIDGELHGDDIVRAIRNTLNSAYNDGILENPLNEIYEYVKSESDGDKFRIMGGLVDDKKPFARTADQIRIKRSDGAWLHFTITLRCATTGKKKGKKVEALWAYDFELVFPDGHSPSFVRFDLNEPGHDNEDREIRSHMHPANDDLLVPAPVMSPEELLDVLLRRLHARDPEHPRH